MIESIGLLLRALVVFLGLVARPVVELLGATAGEW